MGLGREEADNKRPGLPLVRNEALSCWRWEPRKILGGMSPYVIIIANMFLSDCCIPDAVLSILIVLTHLIIIIHFPFLNLETEEVLNWKLNLEMQEVKSPV